MKARLLLGLCALLAFPGCFDPIVGSQCAKGYSRCGSKCVIAGTCTLDAAAEPSGWEAGLAEAGSEPFDGATAETAGAGAGDDGGLLTDADAQAEDPNDPATRDAGHARFDAGLEPEDASEDAPSTPEGDAAPGADGIAESSDVAIDAPVPSPDALADAGFDLDLARFADGSNEDSDDALPCPECDGGVDAPSVETGGLMVDGADASLEDTGVGLGDAEDGGAGSDAEAGPLVCDIGLSACGEQCVDLINDPFNCGVCGTTCATGVCTEGKCLECPEEAPAWCGGQCTNTASDPDNCGGCGIPCGTGLCSNSVCEAAGTGRVILIGHDYTATRTVKNRVVGNAVFMWPINPVRLLLYVGDATATAVQNVDLAIGQVAGTRTVLKSYANSVDVPLWLPNVDVFLIYAQTNAANATLTQMGSTWASALTSFVQNQGGTIIVLDADQPGNAGTVQILSSAGLLNATRQASASASGLVCNVTARGDALATGLTRSYSCQAYSTTFSLGESGPTVTPVIETILGEAASAPVVISKIF
jgi:hypothetical protein